MPGHTLKIYVYRKYYHSLKMYYNLLCLIFVVTFCFLQPLIKIENGRHPCILNIENFVPNDTELGTGDHHEILILTGPNMGGKSTLMRQVALIIIMTQLVNNNNFK